MQIAILLTELQQVKKNSALAVFPNILCAATDCIHAFPTAAPVCNKENIQTEEKPLSVQQALTSLLIAWECM